MESRRGFLKALALAPVVPGVVAPQSALPPAATKAPDVASDAVAEALAEAVRRQFGDHLGAAELEEVRREIERNRRAAERLRAAARLTNADDPVGRFEARPPVPPGRGVAR